MELFQKRFASGICDLGAPTDFRAAPYIYTYPINKEAMGGDKLGGSFFRIWYLLLFFCIGFRMEEGVPFYTGAVKGRRRGCGLNCESLEKTASYNFVNCIFVLGVTLVSRKIH